MDISDTAKIVFKRSAISNYLHGSENGMVFEHVPGVIREMNEEILDEDDTGDEEDDDEDADDDEVYRIIYE